MNNPSSKRVSNTYLRGKNRGKYKKASNVLCMTMEEFSAEIEVSLAITSFAMLYNTLKERRESDKPATGL